MSTLTKYKPKTEKELHGIIQKEIDELEEGLQILKYEFAYGKGIPDFLCVDSGKRLTIIEVKLTEDENILFQALRYYSDIDKYRFEIPAFFKEKIDAKQDARIILIADHFSEDIKRLSTLVKPTVELYEYTALTTKSGEKGIVFHPVALPITEELPTKPNTISDLINYITNPVIRSLIEKVGSEIKAMGQGIEEYPTRGYVGYKFKGRLLAYLAVQRKSFDIGSVVIDENMQLLNYEPTRIENPDQDYSEVMEKIRTSYKNLGGKKE